jgi:hypothetical protein
MPRYGTIFLDHTAQDNGDVFKLKVAHAKLEFPFLFHSISVQKLWPTIFLHVLNISQCPLFPTLAYDSEDRG